MTVGARLRLAGGKLLASDKVILRDVNENVVLSSAVPCQGCIDGAFVGVKSDHRGSRMVFPLGKLEGLRFMCLFRFKMWWMMQWMGNCAKDIPFETQFLLVQLHNDQSSLDPDTISSDRQQLYVVFLPLLEGDFRAVLQGNEQNQIEICLESGDSSVDKFDGDRLVFAACGSNPFDLITDAVKTVEKHLQTFCHRERKTIPDMLNWFGWCTWDAFYTDISAEGVKQGLESLRKGGIPPKFVIIDDGWQSVGMDPTGIDSKAGDTANFADRLLDIKENEKFRTEGSAEDQAFGLSRVVDDIKDKYLLKYVYVWHAIVGYWGGVNPNVASMNRYEPKLVHPVPSPAVALHAPDHVLKSVILNEVGLVDPDKAFDFYNDLHSYLASAGIDGVKVDSQTVLETLGEGYGGRVKLVRKFHEALEESVSRNFRGNQVISCMSHNTDSLYSGKKANVIRASDDFFPRDTASHTIHIASVAYNSIFLGEFMQPDWDMFHSLHPMAEYHGAARAVGGCPIYVSDKPEHHDFDLLKKLALPDGSILRAKLPGRPTNDCLFSDPTRDNKSLLKIWNLNDFNGVIGVFNCQGASWCRVKSKNLVHDTQPEPITGFVTATDVDYLPRVAVDGWNGDTVIYSHRKGDLVYLSKNSLLSVTLNPREYEVYTVVPVVDFTNDAKFGAIGLLDMFNSGGAIAEFKYDKSSNTDIIIIHLKVRGCGLFGAYSSIRPKRVSVDSTQVGFRYEERSGMISFHLDVAKEELYLWNISIEM